MFSNTRSTHTNITANITNFNVQHRQLKAHLNNLLTQYSHNSLRQHVQTHQGYLYFKQIRRSITIWYTNGQLLQQYLQQHNNNTDRTHINTDINNNLTNISQVRTQLNSLEDFATAKAFRTVVLTYKYLSDGCLHKQLTSTPVKHTNASRASSQYQHQHQDAQRTSMQTANSTTCSNSQIHRDMQTDTLNNTNTDTQTETTNTARGTQTIPLYYTEHTRSRTAQTDLINLTEHDVQTEHCAIATTEQTTQTDTEQHEQEIQTTEPYPDISYKGILQSTSDARKADAWRCWIVPGTKPSGLLVTREDDDLYELYTNKYGFEPYSRWLRNKHHLHGYESWYYQIVQFHHELQKPTQHQ